VRSFVGATLLLAACGGGSGIVADGVPIDLDMSHGPVLVDLRDPEGDPRAGVIDLLAPITVIDVDDGTTPSRRSTDLTLLDTSGVARAHLELTVTRLASCPESDCQVGTDPDVHVVDTVIGGDALAPAAARFDFFAQRLTILPDIAGDTAARGSMCEAEVPAPFRGGGTLFLGGTEVDFPARRIAISACLAHDTSLDAPVDSGADVQLVLSTGIGPTILTESAYERWRVAAGGGPALATLPRGRVWMPMGADGAIEGAIGTIDRMALVGYDADRRGPCRQVYAHHLLTDHNCGEGDDCPCDDAQFCKVPGIVELTPPEQIQVVIVDDDHPVLQALRAELRPGTPEVDGILGASALARASLDVDTPNNRLLIRCHAAGCQVRPDLITDDVRTTVARCLEEGAALPPVE
jgi:hypothetical protein